MSSLAPQLIRDEHYIKSYIQELSISKNTKSGSKCYNGKEQYSDSLCAFQHQCGGWMVSTASKSEEEKNRQHSTWE